MIDRARLLAAAALGLALGTTASADWLRFHGSTIPLEGVRIEAVSGAAVVYLDPRGVRTDRPLEDLEAIGFDGRVELDHAEQAIAAGRLDDAIDWLSLALTNAERDVARRWIRARLVQVHDARGEGAAAVGHFAALVTEDEDVSWLSVRPVSPADQGTPTALREALMHLHASRRVRAPALRQRLAAWHQAVAAAAPNRMEGDPDPRQTISGRTLASIRSRLAGEEDGRRPTPAADPPTPARDPVVSPDVAAPPVPAPPRTANEGGRDDSPALIARLLEEGRSAAALSICRRVARDPGNRDLARFLYQYARAHVGEGEPHDAAIMFARAAFLYPESAAAPRCLIELAIVYRDVYRRPEIARRLLERAAASASDLGRDDDAGRAESLLRTLDPTP